MATVNMDTVQSWADFEGDDDEDDDLCRKLFIRGEEYLGSFKWCSQILERHVGICVGGIVAVLLFRIEPIQADEWIWVIIGDLPPAYINAGDGDAPADALRAYIGQMRRWVVAAREGSDTSQLIPVNIEPSHETAQRLESRLDYLEHKILPEWEQSPKL